MENAEQQRRFNSLGSSAAAHRSHVIPMTIAIYILLWYACSTHLRVLLFSITATACLYVPNLLRILVFLTVR